jgi:hypothetical protein
VTCQHGGKATGVTDACGCACDDGYTGENCETPPDLCASIDCGDNGECVNGVCTCESGYTGALCETPDLCASIDCGVHGSCSNGVCGCDSSSGWYMLDGRCRYTAVRTPREVDLAAECGEHQIHDDQYGCICDSSKGRGIILPGLDCEVCHDGTFALQGEAYCIQ